jgi:uncharacterized protein YbjQ (UPF0145 family)
MKMLALSLIGLSLSLVPAWSAQATDRKYLLPIAGGLQSKDAQEKLDGSIKFFFGTQPHPAVLSKFGFDVSNRKTRVFGRSDEAACNWAFLSAMIALQNRAKKMGANAVVNIVSYYNKDTMSSTTEFECRAGVLMAGVVLKGDFVTIGGE